MAGSNETALTSRAYSASISIAGSRVLVYNSVLRFASNTSTCYIEAQPGREFRVEYSSLRPKGQVAKTDIAVALDVDGVRLGMQRIVRCFDVDVGEQRIARFEGHRTSSTTIQPFVFKACSTDPEKPGKIELKFYRVKIEGVNLQPKFIQASGSTSLGSARAATQKEHLKYTWIDHRDSPCETIEFIYMSRSQLVLKGLIPANQEEQLEAKLKAAVLMQKRMKDLEAPPVKPKPTFAPTFVPASIPEPSLTAAQTVSPPLASASVGRAEATEPTSQCRPVKPAPTAQATPAAPAAPETVPRWLPAGWRAVGKLLAPRLSLSFANLSPADPLSPQRVVTSSTAALTSNSTIPASSPSSDRLLITKISAEERRSGRVPSPTAEIQACVPVAPPMRSDAAALLPTPAPSPPAAATWLRQAPMAVNSATNQSRPSNDNSAAAAPQQSLPPHLRDPPRVRPDTPPRRAASISRPAAVSAPEADIKPIILAPMATPPKPSRRVLASLGANAPSPLRPRGAVEASPRTRCTKVEAENARLRLEIAELENAGLKRRLQALREEADRGRENEVQRGEKRRKVKVEKKGREVLVLD